ncbi:MAG: cold shock domain-containing protein [Caldilineales bacterium]|nr:cold shock domain-containing protein [Caldilineales bacterium]
MSDENQTPFIVLKPDRYLECGRCGITFAWTGWEQKETSGEPVLCPGCRHLLALTRRKRGVVKWYDRRKGFGFITAIDGSEVYFNRRSLGKVRSVRRGQLVAFHTETTEQGMQAAEVERLAKSGDSQSG